MTNTFVNYEDLISRFDAIEKERNSLINWYKQRIEVMSARLEKEKLSK